MADLLDDFIPFDFGDEFFEEEETAKTTENNRPAAEPSDQPPKREKEFLNEDLLQDIPLPPWVPDNKRYASDLLDMLHEEIDDYVQFISPTDAEHRLRQITVQRLEAVAQSIWPNALVQVFGSFETQLYLPSR